MWNKSNLRHLNSCIQYIKRARYYAPPFQVLPQCKFCKKTKPTLKYNNNIHIQLANVCLLTKFPTKLRRVYRQQSDSLNKNHNRYVGHLFLTSCVSGFCFESRFMPVCLEEICVFDDGDATILLLAFGTSRKGNNEKGKWARTLSGRL